MNLYLTIVTMKHRIPKAIARYLDDGGVGRVGEATATIIARHAPTSGAGKLHEDCSSRLLMHGYAWEKRTYIPALMKIETSAPQS